jgi:hypothetical protein
MEALMVVVEFGGPTMFARIGIMRALNRRRPKTGIPASKPKAGQGR